MAVALTKFRQFVEELASAVHDLSTGTADTFFALLTNTAPNVADTVVDTNATPCTVEPTSHAAEIAAGNGYTKGGKTCGTVTGAQSNGIFKFTLGTDPVWTATPAAMATFRYIVLYNSAKGAAATRPVIGWYDYGVGGVTLNLDETFTLNLDQTNGVLTVE